MTRALAAALLALLLTGCSGSQTTPAPAAPAAAVPRSPAPTGDLTQAQLRAALLQPADLPELAGRREFASAELTTQATPQLALCRPQVVDAPHALANVLAQSGQMGSVRVFQIVLAYVDPAGAEAAFTRAVADAAGCTAYEVQGVAVAVEGLEEFPLPGADAAAHYRLVRPGEGDTDTRTLLLRGRYLVLLSGSGLPPGDASLLDYQAGVAALALARLP